MGFIYKIDFANGKSYIGQTKHSIEHRLAGHLAAAKAGKGNALASALRKYDFKFDISELAESDCQKERNALEVKFINDFNTIAPNGYNLQSGGHSEFTLSPETKAKLSAISSERLMGNTHRRGKPSSQHVKDRQSVSLIGNQFRLGKPHSAETKAKIGNSLTGRPATANMIAATIRNNKERVWSDESREKIAKSRRGSTLSEALVQKRTETAQIKKYGGKLFVNGQRCESLSDLASDTPELRTPKGKLYIGNKIRGALREFGIIEFERHGKQFKIEAIKE